MVLNEKFDVIMMLELVGINWTTIGLKIGFRICVGGSMAHSISRRGLFTSIVCYLLRVIKGVWVHFSISLACQLNVDAKRIVHRSEDQPTMVVLATHIVGCGQHVRAIRVSIRAYPNDPIAFVNGVTFDPYFVDGLVHDGSFAHAIHTRARANAKDN